MESLIRKARRFGNGAGLVLPKKWLNKNVQVTVLDLSLSDILRDIVEILNQEKVISNIKGIYLVGSYARGDYNEYSDIDILAVSNNIDKELKIDNYQITILPDYLLRKQKGYPLYYSMLKEAKAILNEELLLEYQNKLKLSPNGIREYLKATKLSIKKAELAIKEDAEHGIKTRDAVAYSLILRLRGLYIIDSYINGKTPSRNGIISLIKTLDCLEIYHRYIAMKKDKPPQWNSISINNARKISAYLKEGVKRWEEILKEGKRF